MSLDELSIFCGLNWAVWGDLCKRKHDASLRNTKFNVNWVHAWISEFQCAQNSVTVNEGINAPVLNSSWRPPSMGEFRVDVDAEFDDSKGLFSIG